MSAHKKNDQVQQIRVVTKYNKNTQRAQTLPRLKCQPKSDPGFKSGLILIRMFDGSIPECCGFTALSASLIRQVSQKLAGNCLRNRKKSLQIPIVQR